MSRNLVPEQLYEPGMWTYQGEVETSIFPPNADRVVFVIFLVVVIIAALLTCSRKA